MYYTVIKYDGHLRTHHVPLVFSNDRRVLSQCNTRLKLLYLLNNYKFALLKTSLFTYANSLSTPFHHPCHSLFFDRDHLRSNMGIICGPGSFAAQFGDHLRSGIICGPIWGSFTVRDHLRSDLGIICGPNWGSFAVQFGDHLRSGIICGPIWGSFAVRGHLRSWDHLRTLTILPLRLLYWSAIL